MKEEQSVDKIRQVIIDVVSKAIKENGIGAQQNSTQEPVAQPGSKPEHMTHLRGNTLVYKDHPRIAFRGAIDSLEADIIRLQTKVAKENRKLLYRDLEEVITNIRLLLRCEVTGEPVGELCFQGLNAAMLREHSHHPSKYYGRRHFLPTAEHGDMVAELNRLRTRAREVELVAYKAFKEENGAVSREDILKVLNRLSSLFWIMMFKELGGTYDDQNLVEVEASGRHVHLCRRDVEALFGAGYQLTRSRDLSQPGQYACKERISVTGPKGTLENVVVLGPERKETQVEVSFTDGQKLGLKPPVRQSGQIQDSPGAILSNGNQKVVIDSGVIVAKRHMHVAAKDAERLKIKDGDVLNIEILSSRPVIFKDTVARVSEDYTTYVHIDYDEANACGFEKGICCRIVP